jgi:hypothetical protein
MSAVGRPLPHGPPGAVASAHRAAPVQDAPGAQPEVRKGPQDIRGLDHRRPGAGFPGLLVCDRLTHPADRPARRLQ